jgi:cell wall-associated NlpC family hydrolase
MSGFFMSIQLDPRINPYRYDIAADNLRGLVVSKQFVVGASLWVQCGVAAIRKAPDTSAEQVCQLRFGDVFTVYETNKGWLWGQSTRDGYVGYVHDHGLSEQTITPTHRIKKPTTFLFPEPSIKSPPRDTLTFFSAVEVMGGDTKFAQLKNGGFIHANHLTPIADWRERDIVFNAGRMLNAPYLWGGNNALGLDCSGLIQLGCEAAGIACPRDSDMQAASLGTKIADSELDAKLQRGDIIFFPGHVGIMADTHALLHANAYHGCVVVEPLADVITRGSKVTCVRRLS